MSSDTIPGDLRDLRSCLMCSLIKTFDQFVSDGCENCDRYLGLKNDDERVTQCTSQNFDGFVCMMSPEDSWVAKWQKLHRKVKGVYAVSVSGDLPSFVIEDLKAQGINYHRGQRDMTQK